MHQGLIAKEKSLYYSVDARSHSSDRQEEIWVHLKGEGRKWIPYRQRKKPMQFVGIGEKSTVDIALGIVVSPPLKKN